MKKRLKKNKYIYIRTADHCYLLVHFFYLKMSVTAVPLWIYKRIEIKKNHIQAKNISPDDQIGIYELHILYYSVQGILDLDVFSCFLYFFRLPEGF